MEKLTKKEFIEVLVLLLTERHDKNMCFSVGRENYNEIYVQGPKNVNISINPDDLYNAYKNENMSLQFAVDQFLDVANKKIKANDHNSKSAVKSVEKSTYEKDEYAMDLVKDLISYLLDDVPNCKAKEESESDNLKNIIQSLRDTFEGKAFTDVEQNKKNAEIKKLFSEVNGCLVSKEFFANHPKCLNRPIMDMVFVYHVGPFTDNMEEGLLMADTLSNLNISEQDLYNAAITNMEDKLPPISLNIADGLLLSNRQKKFGATVILYQDLLKIIAQTLNHDILIAPLSEDAVFLLPLQDSNRDEVQALLLSLLQERQSESLAPHLYRYCPEDDTLSFI